MPNASNQFQLYDFTSGLLPGTGSRIHEDVTDVVVNIVPWETPLWSTAPKITLNNTYYEWIEDTLTATATATADGNVASLFEGHVFSANAIGTRLRPGNCTQIFGKDIEISNSLRASNPIGVEDEYMYQIEIALKEIARNVESAAFSNATNSAAGGSGSARAFKPLNGFITTNTASASNAALGHDKATLDSLIEKVYIAGGVPADLFLAPRSKTFYSTELAGFTATWQSAGVGQLTNVRNIAAAAGAIDANIDVYRSNFSTIRMIPDRFIPTATGVQSATFAASAGMKAYLLELPRIQFGVFRPIEHRPMPPAGDSTRGMVLGELGLRVMAEGAHGKVVNLKTATA